MKPFILRSPLADKPLVLRSVPADKPFILRAEPLLKVEHVTIGLLKGIGSVGECVNVDLKLRSALEEVGP